MYGKGREGCQEGYGVQIPQVVVEPETPILCIGFNHIDSREILRRLWDMNWYPYHCGIVNGVRIVIGGAP